MPGRALPAAQPHTELTTIIVVPGCLTAVVDGLGCAQIFEAQA